MCINSYVMPSVEHFLNNKIIFFYKCSKFLPIFKSVNSSKNSGIYKNLSLRSQFIFFYGEPPFFPVELPITDQLV